MKHEVFVSYARADEERVLPFVRLLVDRGWNVWWDQKVSPGVDYADRIGKVLDDSASTLVFWSESSVASNWVKWEARHKLGDRALVQVRLDPVELPFPFNSLQAIDHLQPGPPPPRTLSKLQHRFAQISGPRPKTRAVKAAADPAPAPLVTPPADESPVAAAPGVAALEEVTPQVEAPARPTSVTTPVDRPETSAKHRTTPVAPPAAEPVARHRRKSIWTAGSVVAGLGLAWLIWGGGSPHRRPGVPAQQHLPSRFEAAVDDVTGCRYPRGWEIVDSTQGHDGWARQVREPSSGIVMQLVPPGEFWMGSSPDEADRNDDETLHLVRLTQAFYLGVTEVSWAQYEWVMAGKRPNGRDGHLPVNSVSWSTAVTFCREIGCDLPTEAQWEYAARANSTSRWWWGDDPEKARGRANMCDDQTLRLMNFGADFLSDDGFTGLAPVDSAEPNGFGFKNMIGNVMEWCADDYVAEYGSDPVTDPVNRLNPMIHVARGGSFTSPQKYARAASRLSSLDEPIVDADVKFRAPKGMIQAEQSGFRVALTLP